MGRGGHQLEHSPPSLTHFSNITEDPTKNGVRCGKWVLRPTSVRRSRVQPLSLTFVPATPSSKRKRHSPSPAPSANSFTGENSVQVHIMDRKKLEPDSWSYENTEIFLQIMVEEATKGLSTNSKKRVKFNSQQWAAILEELKKRTNKPDYTLIKIQQKFDRLKRDYRVFNDLKNKSGLGWDPLSETVTASDEDWAAYVQANKDAEKFRDKGLDHYDLLHELLEGMLASGIFGQPSPLGAPTLEQERAMMNQGGKAIRREDSFSVDSRKRMFDGTDGTSSKSMRIDTKEAYDKVAYANQKKGEFYETVTNQRLQAQKHSIEYSIEACMPFLNELKEYVHPDAFWKAYDKLIEGPNHREGFLRMPPQLRIDWINRA